MARLCERPGCSAAAAMAYGFDADRLLVWLLPHDPADDPLRAGVLCTRHADAMIVPRGWTLDDRRDALPRLFRTEPTAPVPRRRTRRPALAPGGEQLSLDTVVAEEPPPSALEPPPPDEVGAVELTVAEVAGPAADDAGDETVAMPWRPSFDHTDDLGGVLAARSPLLARAFRGTDRPR